MHPIIAGEFRKAEALLEGYLKLPSSAVSLEKFEIDRFSNIPPSISRTVGRLKAIAMESYPTQEELAYVINAVDFLEQETAKRRSNSFRHRIEKLESNLKESAALSLVRHGIAILGTLYGVVYCNSSKMDHDQYLYFAVMALYAVASFGTATNSKLSSGRNVILLSATLLASCIVIAIAYHPGMSALLLSLASALTLVMDLKCKSGSNNINHFPDGLDDRFTIDHTVLADPYTPSIARSSEDVQRNMNYGTEVPAPDRYL